VPTFSTSAIRATAGDARITIEPAHGARLAALSVNDLDLLVSVGKDTLHWGCYPMAPWVGRMRDGRFQFAGQTHQLPLTMPPHAIHGTVYDRAWEQPGEELLFETGFGADWPFPGHAVLRYRLFPDRLELRLEVHAHERPFPATCGYHPWFPRQLGRGGHAVLDFAPEQMYLRGQDDMIDGTLVAPSPGPWDDCFVQVRQPVRITWPGALQLELRADTDHWIVYNQPEHALCVEPQTGPPNAFAFSEPLVHPGSPLVLNTTMRWQPL